MAISSPLLSIGMPVYNGELYIQQALDSLLAQDYGDFELIISDNASTDQTPEICLEYERRDKRIRYYRNMTNMGGTWNFNKVFELSSAEYFMWASHDDYWDKRYISSCLKALNMSGAIVLAATACESIRPETGEVMFIDKGVSTIGLTPWERFIQYKSTIHRGNHLGSIYYGIYRKSVLCKIMPARNIIASDHLILAALCFHGELVTLPETLMVKRWGGASVSHRDNANALGIQKSLLIKFPYFIRELFMQKLIFSADTLTMTKKIKTASWSLMDYLRLVLYLSLWPVYRKMLRLVEGIAKFIRGKLVK